MAEKKTKMTVVQSDFEEPAPGEQALEILQADPAPLDRLAADQRQVGEAEGKGPGGEIEQRADQDGGGQHAERRGPTDCW